jgi:hypothetical protein
MGQYSIGVQVTTGAVANTFKTLLGFKLANTAGHRARLKRLIIGGAGQAAQDVNVSIHLHRTDNSADGTSTAVNVNTIASKVSEQIASIVNAIGKNYSAEPTTMEAGNLLPFSLNGRSTIVLGPADFGTEVIWGKNQTLCIEGAPGEALAVILDVGVEWEEGI